MLGLLMRDEDLEIVKVAFAIVTPGTLENLFDIGVLALTLSHCVTVICLLASCANESVNGWNESRWIWVQKLESFKLSTNGDDRG